ncbi:MAG: tetraacyldisaccharide 4'-kinase [Neisseriaceae bacterium]|nr:tetraacyldisaccharide 4'-kinase [Neisseriaceae bacterium]
MSNKKNNYHIIESHWQKPIWWLIPVLYPLSRIFSIIVSIRRFMYRKSWIKSHKLPVPVVIVGNIHVGGSGKTPITAAIVNQLTQCNIKVGIISRGYGRKDKTTRIVNPDDDATISGDEPLLLSHQTRVPIAIGENRITAGKLLLQHFPQIQLIIADDGLQHYAMQRDMEIIVFPADSYQYNLDVLPNGPLRENIARISEADILIISNSENNTKFPATLPKSGKVFNSTLNYKQFYSLNNPEKKVDAIFFHSQPTMALAAIGKPQRFFLALNKMGINLIEKRILPDHANIDIKSLPENIKIIITEKDAVKLNQYQLPNVWVLPIEAELPESLYKEIKCLLK